MAFYTILFDTDNDFDSVEFVGAAEISSDLLTPDASIDFGLVDIEVTTDFGAFFYRADAELGDSIFVFDPDGDEIVGVDAGRGSSADLVRDGFDRTLTSNIVFSFDEGPVPGTFSIIDFDLVAGELNETLVEGRFRVESGLIGTSEGDSLVGGSEGDYIEGRAGDDTLSGAAGDDLLLGGVGDDLLLGGAGDDILDDGSGVDTLDGGAGNDTYRRDLSETFPDQIDFVPVADLALGRFYALAEGPAEGNDIFIDIENIELSGDYDLHLVGDDGANRLSSGAGDDMLFDGAGNDTVLGGAGDDTLVAGGGVDTFDGGPGIDTYRVELPPEAVPEGGYTALIDLQAGTIGADIQDPADFDTMINVEKFEFDLPETVNINFLGSSGDDLITSSRASDTLDGGEGVDTAVWDGAASDYILTLGSLTVTEKGAGGAVDAVENFELLEFGDGFSFVADGAVDFRAMSGVADLTEAELRELAEVYIAYFDRAPDALGLYFYGNAIANGTALEQAASTFINSTEYQTTYPEEITNAQFVETVYNNVIGRGSDQAGFDFWLPLLDDPNNGIGRDTFIYEFLQGVQSGSPDEAFLDSKVDIGLYFAAINGMSDVDNAAAAMDLFDGSSSSIDAAVAAIDGYYADALDPTTGEFLLQLVGVVDDPFSV